MVNLRSKNQANSFEPIVYTFDIDPQCKQYTFGISQYNISKNIEQNLYILKQTPFWKSPLAYEVSSYKDDNNTFVNNFGNTLFGKQIIVFNEVIQSNDYHFNITYDNRNKTMDYNIFNSSNVELNLSDVTINYDIYMESSENDNGQIIYRDGVKLYNKDLILSPYVLQGMIFNSSVSFTETDEIYLTLEDDGTGDLIMLCSDYECTIPKDDELNVTSVIPFVNDTIENVYYTDKSDYDKVRFVMSDYGRYISHSTSTNNGKFENNMGFLLSVKTKDESNKNVSVRFTIDNKDYATNLTSNF